MRFSRLLLVSTALTAVAAPAFAQNAEDTAATQTAAADDASDETIIVTGSRIARPNLVSSVPITSLSAEEVRNTGSVSLGDTLNALPALRSTFSQANSGRFIGTSGLSLLDLRGLGTARTLVLVNGRRHISSQPGVFTVDTNTIPSDLIERVDVVTGGNSAIYGSDAVAGVVNFVMKRDFEGFTARGQYGVSDENDRDQYFVALTGGTNFGADDRGNIAVSVEYSKAHTLYNTDRDNISGAFSGRNVFDRVENTLGEPATGNGQPDRVLLRGHRTFAVADGGLYISACPANTPANAARRAVNCVGLTNPQGAELGRTFVFNEQGELIANPLIRDLRPFGANAAIGGLTSTLRNTGLLQPGLERKSANLLFNYELSPAANFFAEAKFVRIDANQEGQPTFHQGVSYSIDNPFLSTASRALLVSSLAPGATTFTMSRFNVDFGGRGEDHRRDLYRLVAGFEGEFNDDWRYEVAVNFGRSETYYETQGNIDNAKFANARNAVRNAAGNIVCAINADAITTNDDPACVPANLFGSGRVSQAALDYFVVTSSREQWAEQLNATAFISGDSSEWFELPGGPIGFAIGTEYRRESAYSAFDPFTRSGATFLNSIAVFDPPALNIKELFGEIRLPLLADRPFFQELTLEASGRLSDYSGSVGTVFAYNIGGTWAPVEDIRARVGYARSVRSPTLSDQYTAGNQTFANAFVDPCDSTAIVNNPNRKANCAAAGVPTTEVVNGVTVPWSNVFASGLLGLNSGNPNVVEERGKSWTIGAVVTPSAIPGLSVSLDWYDITVDDVIFTLLGQTLINQCYDAPGGVNNQFCANVFRRPDGTFNGQSSRIVNGNTVQLPVLGPGFISSPLNFAKQETRGVDLDLNYRTQIGSIDASFRSIMSWVLKRNNYTDPSRPDFADRQLSELGDPAFEASFNMKLDFGKLDFDYTMRYIGKQVVAAQYEDQNSFQGRPPNDPDAFDPAWYPDVFYHSVRLGYDFNEKFRFYAGVDNLFDRLPPYDLIGTLAGDPFDNTGRFFYAGASIAF